MKGDRDGQGVGFAAAVYRGSSAFLAIYVAGSAISFGVQLLMARLLGAPSYGTFVYAISWAPLLLLGCNFGLKPTTVRFVAAYNASDVIRHTIRESLTTRFAESRPLVRTERYRKGPFVSGRAQQARGLTRVLRSRCFPSGRIG